MRKQKKNLTAKRRQLNKNNQQYDAQGQRIEIELSETDRYAFCYCMLRLLSILVETE